MINLKKNRVYCIEANCKTHYSYHERTDKMKNHLEKKHKIFDSSKAISNDSAIPSSSTNDQNTFNYLLVMFVFTSGIFYKLLFSIPYIFKSNYFFKIIIIVN